MYQLHHLMTGEIRLLLEDRSWHIVAPACFMPPPPAMPHGFLDQRRRDGLVLTVKQEVLWKAFAEGGTGLRICRRVARITSKRLLIARQLHLLRYSRPLFPR
jgi:hypothetical protein